MIQTAREMASDRGQPSHIVRTCAILKSVHGRPDCHPPAARARRIGQRLAAARRPGHADRHRAARRRARWRRSRRACAARGCASRTSSSCWRRITTSTTSASPPPSQRRSGADRGRARPRRPTTRARYSAEVEADRRFARALMRHHGVPEPLVADTEELWDYIRATTEDVRADVRLADGDRVRAGGRSLRVVDAARATARPTRCSSTTATRSRSPATTCWPAISSNTEICPPDRARDGRARSRRALPGEPASCTAAMPLARLLTGHGEPVTEHGGWSTRACATIAAAASASWRSSAAARARRSRSPAACGPCGRCASSRSSSSGRWSATSSCCWTPARWPSGSTSEGSVFELDPAAPAARADALRATPPAAGPRLRGPPVSRTPPARGSPPRAACST